MSINERLKILLKELHLSQNAMGKVMNISSPAIGKLISGQSSPNIDTLIPLIEKYRLNCNWLILGEGNIYLDVQNTILSEREIELLADLNRCIKRNESLQDRILDLETTIKDYGHSRKKHSSTN